MGAFCTAGWVYHGTVTVGNINLPHDPQFHSWVFATNRKTHAHINICKQMCIVALLKALNIGNNPSIHDLVNDTGCPYWVSKRTGCPNVLGVHTGCPNVLGVQTYWVSKRTGCPYWVSKCSGCPYWVSKRTGCPNVLGVHTGCPNILGVSGS